MSDIQDLLDELEKEGEDLDLSDVKPSNVTTLADMIPDIDMSSLPSSLQFDGETDIDDKPESLKEAVKSTVSRFFEDTGHREAIMRYIKDVFDEHGGHLDYHNFKDDGYFSFEDFEERGYNTTNLTKPAFNTQMNTFFYGGKFNSDFNMEVGMRSSSERGQQKQKERDEEINKAKPSFNSEERDAKSKAIYKNMHRAKDVVSDVERAVEAKYNKIESVARDIASEFGAYSIGLIAGAPGIGKTYCVEQAIEQGLKEWEPNERHKVRPTLVKVSGSIGKSYSDIVAFFYTNKNNKLILLDDADGFLDSDDQDIRNFLKVLVNGNLTPISVSPSIIARANSTLAKEREAEEAEEMEESSKNPNIKFDKFGNIMSLNEDSLYDKTYKAVEKYKRRQDKEESYDADGNAKKLTRVKNKFIFDSSIILISNLPLSKVDKAVLSRMFYIDIYLNPAEFICRAEQILPAMKVGKYSSTRQEVIEWMKKESFAYLKILLINNDKYSDFHIELNCTLTFRIIEKITGEYLSHALRFCRTNKLNINDPNNRLAIQNGVEDNFIDGLIAILETKDVKKTSENNN